MKTPEVLTLAPARYARGDLRLPGSKSLSNRALLLAALAKGVTHLSGVLDADDTRVMRESLTQLGIVLRQGETTTDVVVEGQGEFPVRAADLFLGNAGTALRPLTAVLALSEGHYRLRGVPRMHERPIADLVDALRTAGLALSYDGVAGFPPLTISPAQPQLNGSLKVRGDVSSQFLSALLMAAPLLAKRCAKPITIEVQGPLISQPYITLTLALMARFGQQVHQPASRTYVIDPEPYISPGSLAVEGDASSASYFLAMGLLGGGPVRLDGLGIDSTQGDLAFAYWLRDSLGAQLEMNEDHLMLSANGIAGGKSLPAFDQDFNAMPDAAMTAAVLALFADGPCRLRNIASWRVKETDRITAMQTELARLGAQVEATNDSLTIHPPQIWRDATIRTYDDHRMAMCFSLAAFGGVNVGIEDPRCVDKTFPDYFTVYQTLLRDAPTSSRLVAASS